MNKKEEKKKDARYDPTLTAEERKDARKLTEKEWLYRIGRSNDGMWDQSKETLFKCDLSKKIASHSGEFGYASLEGWFDAINACEDAMGDMR